MKTIILAAGLSTRTYPYTKSIPKPMLLINGKPMLEYVIVYLSQQGYRDIIVTLHYKSEKIISHFGNGDQWNVHIQYSFEDNLLDTAGSIKLLKNYLNNDFLVCSGSYLPINLNLNATLKFHKLNQGIGTIVLAPRKNNLEFFGQAVLDKENRIIEFKEKPLIQISNWVHTTYQFYSPKVLSYIPVNKKVSIPDYLIPTLLKDNKSLYGFCIEDFFNISSLEQYETTKQNLPEYLKKSGCFM